MIREFLPVPDLLAYLEAILRVYNRYGRRDNIHKARIKVLVKSLGIERFREQVEAEWQRPRAHCAAARSGRGRARARLLPAASLTRPAEHRRRRRGREPEFQAWYRYNTRAHKVPGYRAVFVSLKAPWREPRRHELGRRWRRWPTLPSASASG